MRLRIEEIQYKNIREFGDLKLDFTRDETNDTHHISLVQMPNGTGKTTTMGLIRHLILGTEFEDEGQVKDYQPEYNPDSGQFSIAFATESKRFRLQMNLDYNSGTVSYNHTSPQREGGGFNPGHSLPLSLEDTITESFVDLFIFNGELTEKFTNTSEDNAETALKIVNRLDRIETQRDRIYRRLKAKQEDAGATTEQGLKTLSTELKKREKKIRDLKSKRDDLKVEVKKHSEEISSLEKEREEIIAQDQESFERYQELEEKIDQLEQSLNNQTRQLLSDMRRPSRLSERLNDDFTELLEHMTILKLPKSTSEEFFNELAEEDQCICGRELTESHRENIKSNAQDYLSDEDIGVLNALKEQLRNTGGAADLDPVFNSLSETRQELKQAQMEQDGLDLENPELEKRKQELTEMIKDEEQKRDEKKQQIELLTTDDKGKRDQYGLDWKSSIPLAKHELNKYQEKVEEATDTVEYSKKADRLEKMFDRFIGQSLEQLKSHQIARTNERLRQILGLSEVQIESIDDSIKLEGKSGSSEGQSLSVAYAYLSTLFEGSHIDFPFVVDSPAVSLDHKVRREVATIVSELFDQLVAFVISTEKEGFVENLEPRLNEGQQDIQYFTIHKTEAPGEVRKHTDEEFFMQFTSEEEESMEAAGGE